MSLHDQTDDILPFSRLFLHITRHAKEDTQPGSRRESIDPIPEMEEENDGDSEGMPAGGGLHAASRRRGSRISMVARLSLRFQKFTRLGDYRRAKNHDIKQRTVYVSDDRSESWAERSKA